MIDCTFIIYALDDAFFYIQKGDIVPYGFGFGVLYVMTIYELNDISYSNLVYYSATAINIY